MPAGFQSQVYAKQAPAMAGDFSSANPRHSAQAGEGAYVAGAGGVTISRFVWSDATDTLLLNTGTGVPTGFLHREQGTGLITTYLAETSNIIPQGFMVTAHKAGDFWVKNAGAGAVTKGMKVFANTTDGTANFAAAGATVAGSVETKWYAESAGAAGELIKMTTTYIG